MVEIEHESLYCSASAIMPWPLRSFSGGSWCQSSISDREQLVVFGGRGVALALKFKLNGFRKTFYGEQP